MEGKKHGKRQAGVIEQAGFAGRDRTCRTRPLEHLHLHGLGTLGRRDRLKLKGQGQDMMGKVREESTMGLTMHVSSGLFLEGEKVDRKSWPDRAGEIQKIRHGKRQCWLDRAGATKKAGQSSQDRLNRTGHAG
jgi:hypothetical protein